MNQVDADASPPKNIALCLSGGGLRATFFHLGVITALREAGMLRNIREVFSVSGGSITAGHLALHWNRYNGPDDEFFAVCNELRKLGSRDIRGRVLRRWILSLPLVLRGQIGLPRAGLLKIQYEFLFSHNTLRQAKLQNTDSPKFYILSTSFNTGDLCSFSDDLFTIHGGSGRDSQREQAFYPADNVRLSTAVAASSAFPPLFPPLRLTWDMLGDAPQGGFSTIALTDGGVFDNLGFEKFAMLDPTRMPSIDCLIISDGGGAFHPFITSGFSWPLSRNVRATDILMRRTGDQTSIRAASLASATLRVVPVNIGSTSASSSVLVTTQTRLQSIRTDLDKFSASEIDLLVDHGVAVTYDALGLRRSSPERGPDQSGHQDLNFSAKPEETDRLARKASSRRIGLIERSDWLSYVLVLCCLILAALAAKGGKETIRAYAYFKDRIERGGQAETLQEKLTERQQQVENLQIEINSLREIFASFPKATDPTAGQATAAPLDNKAPDTVQQVKKDIYTVWIQFAGSLTREQMKDFGNRIVDNGWSNAPGAKQGGERTPRAAGLNEVRYGPDTPTVAAQQLADEISALKIVPTPVVLKQLAIIPRNSLEVWISR